MLKKFSRIKISRDIHFMELVKGFGISFFFQFLGIGCGYIFTVLVTRSLGAKAWGTFTIVSTVLQIISIIGKFGMDLTLLRFVAEYSSQKKWELIKKIYLKTLKLIISLSLFLSIILFFLSPYIAKYIFRKDYLTIYFRIISTALVPFVLLCVNRECIRGLKKIKEYAFLNNVAVPFFTSLILLVFFSFYKQTFVLIIAYTISIYISSFLSFFLCIKKLKLCFPYTPKKTKKYISPAYFSYRELLSISIPMFLSTSMFIIMQWIDTIMLGILKNAKEVGIYNVIYKISMITSIFLTAVNTIAAPKFAEFWGNKDIEGLSKISQQSAKLIFWFSFPVLLFFLFFPSYILRIFGEEFIVGTEVLRILILGQFINSISGSVGYLLQMTGKQKVFRNIILCAIIINIILNYILIPNFGMEGAAIASTISLVFWNIFSVLYIKRTYKISTFYLPKILLKRGK